MTRLPSRRKSRQLGALVRSIIYSFSEGAWATGCPRRREREGEGGGATYVMGKRTRLLEGGLLGGAALEAVVHVVVRGVAVERVVPSAEPQNGSAEDAHIVSHSS